MVKRKIDDIPEELHLGCEATKCRYPEVLVKAWKKQDLEHALKLIFRDYSYHLKMGMSKDTQDEFFNVLIHEIESLGDENE